MPIVTTLSGQTLSIDLSTRDFEGFRSDALRAGGLADLYLPSWSDRSSFDLGVALVEALAFMADNLSYYQDRIGNEALFPSAVQRRSIIEHCKLLGYELSPAVCAIVDLTITSSGSGTLPIGTSFTVDSTDGSSSVTFELLTAVTFTGVETKNVYAYEGVTYQETLGSSSGTADQRFTLLRTPLAMNPDGSASLVIYVVYMSVPVEWTEVENFLDSGPTDQHYRKEIDEYDVVTIIFGDGINGALPSSGTGNVLASYRVGGGTKGNEVAIGKITRINGSYPFIASVTNLAAPNSGMEKETIEEAKVNAPLSLRALDRCVTNSDYAAIAKEVPGVKHAIASRGNGAFEERLVIATSGNPPIPTGTWDPYMETGSGLLYAVGTYVTQRKATPVVLKVEPVRVVEVYLSLNVHCLANVRSTAVQRLVEDYMTTMFDSDNQVLGQQFAMSKIYEAIESIYGVEYVDIIQMQRHPNPRQVQGGTTDITFESFYVSPNSVAEVYSVNFLGATTFEVVGRSTGYQGSGTVGTYFTSSDQRLSFSTVAGTVDPSNTCKFEIITSAYVSNINPASDELTLLRDSTFQLIMTGGLA